MTDRLKRRAFKAGLLNRIDVRIASADSLGLQDLRGAIDFTLAFAVVHEFPDPGHFFAEVAAASKPGAALLLAEPKGHVKLANFDAELEVASAAGFNKVEQPAIRGGHTALVKKI
jgi:SAM-dependent methyltransferase